MNLCCTSYIRLARSGFGGLRCTDEAGAVVGSSLRFSLLFFQKVLYNLKPRDIRLIEPKNEVVSYYSDAAWEMDTNSNRFVGSLGYLINKGHISQRQRQSLQQNG